MASNQPRIVIVGAGMAGLSAAVHLVEQGLSDVIILEAADRIGGRIHTVPLDDGPPIELGANWIHGATKENSTFELADKLGVLYPYRNNNRFSCRFLKEDGEEIDRVTVTEVVQSFQRIVMELRRLLPNAIHGSRSKGYDTPISLQSELENRLNIELNSYAERHPDRKEQLEDMKRAYNVMKTHLTFHEGDELDKVAWERVYDDMPGGDIHIPGGYRQLLDHLLNRLQNDCLRLNHEVVKIKMNSDTRSVEISIRNGVKMAADHVIVTCSLGYLKKNHSILFDPSLPIEKVGAIKRMGLGRVNKIFLEFDRPLYRPTYQSIGFAWNHLNIGKDKSEWFRNIFGFSQVFTRDNTLLGWIAGDGAEHMETLSDGQIGDTCVKILRKFLRDDSIPYPKKVLVSRWCSNSYVLGSYTYLTPNLKPGDIGRLQEPVRLVSGEPKLLFAGEATDEEEYGCTHGARNSGLREARRLCDIYSYLRLQSKI